MKPNIAIGASHNVVLREALLIYDSTNTSAAGREAPTFVTRHNITTDEGKQPQLGPAQALSREFLKTLSGKLGTRPTIEIFPGNVLARTDLLLAWWSPAQPRPMFFADAEKHMTPVSGRTFPHPALVFVAKEDALYVRALTNSQRPGADTHLYAAPYWNMYQDGHVCLGSMRTPDSLSIGAIPAWEHGFFASAFTHPGDIAKLTSYCGGFTKLWKDLAGSAEPFPSRYLVDTGQTLSKFLEDIDS